MSKKVKIECVKLTGKVTVHYNDKKYMALLNHKSPKYNKNKILSLSISLYRYDYLFMPYDYQPQIAKTEIYFNDVTVNSLLNITNTKESGIIATDMGFYMLLDKFADFIKELINKAEESYNELDDDIMVKSVKRVIIT